MAGRPPTYQSADERPVSVSLRIPRALYDQAQQKVQMRRMTLTEALLEGLHLWLETSTDPREVFLSDDSNTVMQQLQTMVTATVQAEFAKFQSTALPPAMPDRHPTTNDSAHDNGNTVLQKETSSERHPRKDPLPMATLRAIAEARTQHPGMTIRAFGQHLFATGIYQATSRTNGTAQPPDAGWVHRQLVRAREEGLL